MHSRVQKCYLFFSLFVFAKIGPTAHEIEGIIGLALFILNKWDLANRVGDSLFNISFTSFVDFQLAFEHLLNAFTEQFDHFIGVCIFAKQRFTFFPKYPNCKDSKRRLLIFRDILHASLLIQLPHKL